MRMRLAGLIVVWLVGCAMVPSRPPYLEPSKTAVLPVVDLRHQPHHGVDMALILENAYLAELLQKRGYHVVFVSNTASVKAFDRAAFEAMSPSQWRELGPKDARWLILAALYEVRPTPSLLSAFAATCASRLFDRARGQVVWQKTLVYRELAGSDIQSDEWRSAVAQGCFRYLLKTLPNRQ